MRSGGMNDSIKRRFGGLIATVAALVIATLVAVAAGLLGFACVQSAAAQAAVLPNRMTGPAMLASAAARGSGSGFSADTDRPALQQRNPRYRLCASDVIALTFPLTPEYDQTVSVQPDGFITLAGAG